MNELLLVLKGYPLLDRYGSALIVGFGVTIKLVFFSFTLGMTIGLLLALGGKSKISAVRSICRFYIFFFRGSPLLAQLFVIYYGLGAFKPLWQEIGIWWFLRDPWYCTLAAFVLNTAAYQAEIFRGAFLALPVGQYEASQSLSLDTWTVFTKITFPQMFRIAMGPLGNELILTIKSSAIASLVTIYDLMGVAKLAFSRTFEFDVYIWVAACYLVLVEILRRSLLRLDRYLGRHLK